jgi:rhodanese-related sulfurtransferase
MCSIYGAVGHSIDDAVLMRIRDRAKDRGRDGGRLERVPLTNGMMSVLGNWRATPTTEVNAAPFQPYGGIVHNGTIANDAELGARPGEVDSMVLPRVLARTGLRDLVESLGRVRGSYALAVRCEQTVLLASNFKPIYFLALGGTLYFSSMERHLAPEAPRGVRPARLAPYTAMDLVTGEVRPLPRETNRHALVVCSSGLDSTTAAYALAEAGWQVTLLHFLYGCHAETQEARLVRAIGAHLRAPVAFLSIDYSQFKGNSPLLNDVPIADGLAGAEYAHEWVRHVGRGAGQQPRGRRGVPRQRGGVHDPARRRAGLRGARRRACPPARARGPPHEARNRRPRAPTRRALPTHVVLLPRRRAALRRLRPLPHAAHRVRAQRALRPRVRACVCLTPPPSERST